MSRCPNFVVLEGGSLIFGDPNFGLSRGLEVENRNTRGNLTSKNLKMAQNLTPKNLKMTQNLKKSQNLRYLLTAWSWFFRNTANEL